MLGLFNQKKLNPNVPTSLQQSENEALSRLQQIEKDRFFSRTNAFNQRNPRAKLLFAALGGLSLLVAFKAKYQKQAVVAEIERRKEALSQPVVQISDVNGTTIPWNSSNVEQWLHRPVQITGRQLHNRTMMLPSSYMGLAGYEYVVPLCTKETPEGDPIEGVLLNKGFIPQEFAHVAHRMKIENSFRPETFTAYVSRLEEYQDHGVFSGGNEPVNLERNKWTYADLEDMARTSGFQNINLVKQAALEVVDLNTPLDERDTRFRALDSDYSQDYPYHKTRSGALQCSEMPWQFDKTFNRYFGLGIGSFLFSALLFVAK